MDSKFSSILRGFRGRCPHCGSGALFRSYLKPVANCAACGEAFSQIRADDFPPWLTVIVVGHLVVPLLLLTNRMDMSVAAQLSLWLPTTFALVLLLLPRFKGAIVGLMWSMETSHS